MVTHPLWLWSLVPHTPLYICTSRHHLTFFSRISSINIHAFMQDLFCSEPFNIIHPLLTRARRRRDCVGGGASFKKIGGGSAAWAVNDSNFNRFFSKELLLLRY